MALCGGLLHSPQGQAATGNPYCDLYISSRPGPADKIELSRLGYRPVSSPNLHFSVFSLRLHTDQGAWVLEREAKFDRLYFEFSDGLGNVPIMNFTFKAKGLASCAEIKKSIEALEERRRLVLKAVRYLRGDTSVRLFDAVLDLEQLEMEKRGKRVRLNLHYLNPLRTAAQDAWVRGARSGFFDRLDGVRKTVITRSLRRYCRDQTTLTELSAAGCTNCVGQTAFLVSLYSDLRIQPPAPWQLGFVLYDDHMQPVLYDAGRNQIIDLMYNKVTVNKGKNPVLAPSELLRMALRKHRELLLPLDKVVIDRVEYLSPESMLDFFTASRQAEPDVTAANAHSRIDAFSFQGIRTRSQYSLSPTPATADLSAAADADYDLAPDVKLGRDEALSGSARVAGRHPPSEPARAESDFVKPSQYPRGSFSRRAIETLIAPERELYQQMVRADRVTALDVARVGAKQVGPQIYWDVLTPFELTVTAGLSGYAPFRVSRTQESVVVEVPTQALADELRAQPLLRRYQRLIELGRQFAAGPLRQDVEDLADLFESRTFLEQIASENSPWPARLSRLRLSAWGWGIGVLHLWPAIFEFDRLSPQAYRMDAAAAALSERWGREHRQFLEQAARLPEERIEQAIQFLAQLSIAKVHQLLPGEFTFERRQTWESLTRPLMLAILYDKKHIWSGPRTAAERRQRETLESAFVPVEETQTMELSGPPVELPKLGTCAPGQSGWVASGSFAWRCPESPQKRVLAKLGTQSVSISLRSPREIPASLLSGLVTLNHRLFLHPGHLALLHEMWTDSLDRAQGGHIIWLLSGGPDLAALGRSVTGLWTAAWKFAPMLLSEKMPVGDRPLTGREFLTYTSQNREFPEWVNLHPNYVQAYLHFRSSPRTEVGKRNLRFAGHTPAEGWSTHLVATPGGQVTYSVVNAAVGDDSYSHLNPSFTFAKASANGKELELSLEARFGRRRLIVHLADDGRTITASPTSDVLGLGSSHADALKGGCPEYKTLTLADGEVHEDSMDALCTN